MLQLLRETIRLNLVEESLLHARLHALHAWLHAWLHHLLHALLPIWGHIVHGAPVIAKKCMAVLAPVRSSLTIWLVGHYLLATVSAVSAMPTIRIVTLIRSDVMVLPRETLATLAILAILACHVRGMS